MSKFTKNANEWIENHSEGKAPRKKFMEFCSSAVDVENINMTEEQAAYLFNIATGKAAYKRTCGIQSHMAEQLRAAIETIDRNISKAPKTLAELMGCHLEENAWSGTATICLPTGGCWADKSTLANHLRDILADATERGYVNRETISSCGIILCYRYSL